MVEYVDGSILAQLGNPDMRTPIACAFASRSFPRRIAFCTDDRSASDTLKMGATDHNVRLAIESGVYDEHHLNQRLAQAYAEIRRV